MTPTITLNDLLDHERVTSIDLLSIDVELHEPQVLRGFDIARFETGLMCFEAHPEVRQAILDYFAFNRYVIVGGCLRADQHNRDFHPLDQRRGAAITTSQMPVQSGAATGDRKRKQESRRGAESAALVKGRSDTRPADADSRSLEEPL